MKTPRTWMAFSASLTVHVALVLALGMGLAQPRRAVNRIEVNLEGAITSGMPPSVQAPTPVAGPEKPSSASLPITTSVAPRLAVSAPFSAPPIAVGFDVDGEHQPPIVGGVPGPTSVALRSPGAGENGSGAGSGLGLSGGGQGRQGTGAQSALAGYLNAIRARIDAAKRYPPIAQQRRQEGVVVVTFRLTSDGRLLDTPVVTRSSGFRHLDNAALLAVSRGAPYPVFPLDPDEMKALEIPVKFFLR